jgi:hypothetical protein
MKESVKNAQFRDPYMDKYNRANRYILGWHENQDARERAGHNQELC